MYPILSPVASFPSALLNLGAMEHSLSQALGFFSNQPNVGLSVPVITADWERITGLNAGSVNPEDMISSLRRLHDAGTTISDVHRELESRFVLMSNPKSSQHGTDLIRLDQARLKETVHKPSARKSDAGVSSRSKWRLAYFEKDKTQGSLFVNDDGRAIHLRNPGLEYITLGYGTTTNAMHYVEISLNNGTNRSAPFIRSIALFLSSQTHTADFSPPYFSAMVRSLLDFYAGAEPPQSKIIVTGTFRKLTAKPDASTPPTLEGVSDDAFLGLAYRSLSLSEDFGVALHKTIDGSRNTSFKDWNKPVPLAEFRYVAAENRVISVFYRPLRSSHSGESGLGAETSGRLVFPKPHSRPPRQPSRPQ